MEGTDCDKHRSLLRYCINKSEKNMFYGEKGFIEQPITVMFKKLLTTVLRHLLKIWVPQLQKHNKSQGVVITSLSFFKIYEWAQ